MPREEDDDLYDEEFDFVDEEDGEEDRVEDTDIAEEPAADERQPRARKPAERREDDLREDEAGAEQGEEPVDEYGRPEPAANYVVHIYENKKFKRTIERPFTPEDAEAFATEYNRTAKSYGRVAAPGKNDAKPKKSLD
jgi:hypothetical protein